MIAHLVYFSPQEYLELEHNSNIRHEYQQGLVYAMTGGSDDHDELTLNFLELMRQQVRNQGCSVRSGNVKVNYADDFFYYPDAFVTCDPRDREDRYIKRYPKLIVEVLSPSTETFDRGTKFTNYKKLATLEEYVLVSQDQMEVECRRAQGELWETVIYRQGEQVELVSIGLRFPIEVLYRGVSWGEESWF
ncbi:Uma2 family endonuclease [Spirulina subsalsa]|uniref:Uma2 family endonuclease n=1 Tax=Spirulina subsalsa TaxID=54311 RepID=UPI000474AB00|nr:Uma2 family endonuclease [Spirulina subsalsa]